MKLIQTTAPTLEGRNQKGERIRPWSLRKGDHKHNNLRGKKNQRNTAQMKEQPKNTEVQIKWRENRKIIWKIFQNTDSKDDKKKKNLENKMDKM